MWGSVTPYTDGELDWSTYKYCNGSYDTLTKYNTSTDYGKNPDDKTTLDSEDDAARVNMGGDWRMPTEAECEEIINNTDSEWIEDYNGTGVNGMKFTSKTDKSKYIFIPITLLSCRIESAFTTYSNSRFWSSTLASSTTNAWVYDISTQGIGKTSDPLCNGLHIRPVKHA